MKKKKNPKNHGEKQIKAVEEQGKQLAKSNARGEKKVEHLIGNKKYSVNLLRKIWKQFKNCEIVLVLII